MVLAALGTLGVAAWFSLIDARSHQVEASMKALERRVAVENGRALAQRAFYSQYLHANTYLANDVTCELPDGKGRATIRAFSTVALRSDTIGSFARNGATPLTSNSTDVRVDVANGAATEAWTYRLRNFHPVAGGDLLTIHPPVNPTDNSSLVSGNLHVKGRAVFWDATTNDLKNGLRAETFSLPGSTVGNTTFSTPSNTATLPLNYPNYLRTSGTTSSGPAYRGELELLSASVNPQNSYEARLQAGAPLQLNGTTAKSEGNGVPTIPNQSDDAATLAFIDSNPPSVVTETLDDSSSLSSTVLIAAVRKSNPALTDAQVLQIFDAQSLVPDDALTEMMAAVDEASLTPALDAAITAMNERNGAQYNVNGAGKVQFFLERPEISRIVVTNVKHLRLFGQSDAASASAAAALSPLVIVVDNRGGESLDRIDLVHDNTRPLIIVAASPAASPDLPLTAFSGNSAFPSFRAVFDLQNTGLAFDLDDVAGAKILGGIRGNHRITVSNGTLTLDRDPDIAVLTPFLSRDAWIETVRN